MKFTQFSFTEQILEGIDMMGFKDATPIQQQAIPIILENRDLVACAQTGTGKTAAFLLPLLQKIMNDPSEKTNTLILVPTRELAVQIDRQLEAMSYYTGVSSIAIYGGNDANFFETQKAALSRGTDIVIATPGRLIAHLNLNYVDFSELKHLIMDEADRMLDMGFYPDIMKIINQLPTGRQTLLFSATMPPKILELSKKILKEHEIIEIAVSKTAEGVLQAAYLAYDNQKTGLAKYLLENKKLNSVLIFASTKRKVKDIRRSLDGLDFSIGEIHSDLEQEQRKEVLQQFAAKKLQILVGTNIVSRGIHIDDVELVINYDVPRDAEDYVHRVGRTARAKNTGVALTFINPEDISKFMKIEELIKLEIHKLKLPAFLGEAPEYKAQKRQYKLRNYKNKGNKKR